MSDSESTGGKYDSDDSFFDPAAEYGWLGEYGKLLRAPGPAPSTAVGYYARSRPERPM